MLEGLHAHNKLGYCNKSCYAGNQKTKTALGKVSDSKQNILYIFRLIIFMVF